MNNTVCKTIMPIRSVFAYNSLVNKHNAAVRKISDINGNRRQLWVQRDNLEEQVSRQKRQIESQAATFQKKLNKAEEEYNALELTNENLRKKLAKSEKNDSPKDPKTGEFVSKKKAPAKKKAAKKTTKKKK